MNRLVCLLISNSCACLVSLLHFTSQNKKKNNRKEQKEDTKHSDKSKTLDYSINHTNLIVFAYLTLIMWKNTLIMVIYFSGLDMHKS